MKGPRDGSGGGNAGGVPKSVRPHVRARFAVLARECIRSAERGEMVGASLSLLSVLADMGVKSGAAA